MQKLLTILFIINSITNFNNGYAQGWVAVIDLDFNHNLYAYEKISNASFTYSGVMASGSSETSNLQLIIPGTGPISGDMNLTINGLAFEPYYRDDPYSETISATFSGNHTALCTKGFFEKDGETYMEQVYIWIEVFPRLEIADFINNCDELSFTTNTCSGIYVWEVSESMDGAYKAIAGKNSSSITITREELVSIGFPDPYGRKYFRVTGQTGTTSQIQPMDIYYPPATASAVIVAPKCHDGSDGSVEVNITSPNQSLINDFVITMFNEDPEKNDVRQTYVNDAFNVTIGDLPAGTYRLRIENNSKKETYGACLADYEVEPLINPTSVTIPSFELSDHNGYQIKCTGGTDGSIKAVVAGGTGTYSAYEWTPGVSTTNIAKDLPEGNYQIRVKDTHGCWSEIYTRNLSSPEKLSATLISTGGKNGFDVSCLDKTDGALETNISGGVPDYVYAWPDGSTEANLVNAGPGLYTVTITDANGCTTTGSATLAAPEPIDFSIAEIADIKCPGDHSGILEIQSPQNTIGEVYYSWSTGELAKEITNKPSGTYDASVYDDQGCITTKRHLLVEPPAWSVEVIASSIYNGSNIRCFGEDNGKLAAITRDEENNIVSAEQYTWYKEGKELISSSTLSELDELTAGTYKVEIIYRSFCKAEETIALKEPDPVVTMISNLSNYNGMAISCYGEADGSIRATAAGGTGNHYTYTWEAGKTGPELTGLGPGTYIVTARDINGCVGRAERSLKEPEPVEAMISVRSDYHGQALTCADASDARLRASATGGTSSFTYAWNSGQTTQELTGIPAGHYFLTATDANGCTGVRDTTLLNPLPVTAHIAESSNYNNYGVSCSDGSDGYLLSEGSGGTGIYDFKWEGTAHSGPRIENLPAGTYTVVVQDQNGCTGTAQGIITGPEPLSFQVYAIKNVSCNNGANGEILLMASGGTGNYLFSPSGENWQQAALLKELKAGIYQPVVKDANDCQQRLTQTLTEPPAISIRFEDIEPALCGEANGKVSAVVKGGTGSYQYQWTDSKDQFISADAQLSAVPSGAFTLTVTDDHQCEATGTVGITATNGPKVTITNMKPSTCHNSLDGSALLTAEGEGPFTFLWEDGQTTAEGTNLGKGDHPVEITDADHCTVVESITITGPDSLEIELVEKIEPACFGHCNGTILVSGKGGNGHYTFDWENFKGQKVTNLCAGKYEVTATDEKGCVSKKSFLLLQPDAMDLKLISAQSPNCMDGCDGSIEVAASGGTGAFAYEWDTGSNIPAIANLCAGSYSLTVTDDNDCTATETIRLENPEGIILDLGGSITVCAGQTHLLDPGAHWDKYSWGSNTGFKSSQRRVTISGAGLYWVEVVTSKGCVVQDTFMLKTSEGLLEANFLLTTEAMAGDTVVMIDISWPLPENILWTLPPEMERLLDSGDVLYGKFEKEGEYQIALTASLGECRDEIRKSITIISDDEPSLEEGRLGHEPFVKEFILYPNPNSGMFDVVVEFMEESPLTITVWNALTAKKIGQVNDKGRKSYMRSMDLRPVSPGTYTLRLDYKNGTKYKRFIVR